MIDYVIWLVTNECNSECQYCYAYFYKNLPSLSLEEIKDIVLQMKQEGIKKINLTGGEPLLRGDIEKIIEFIKSQNIKVSLQTNGILLDEKILNFLKQNEVFLHISLNGDEREHDLTRGKGSFKEVMRKIELLPKFSIKFALGCCISSINYKTVDFVIKVAKDFGAVYCWFLPTIPIGKAKVDMMPTSNQLKEALYKLQETSEKISYKSTKLFCMGFVKKFITSNSIQIYTCSSDKVLDISPDGWTLLCDASGIKLSCIKEIGFKEALKRYKEAEMKLFNSKEIEECRGCEIYNFCKGGCFARSYLVYKNFYKKDPLCFL